MYDTNSPKPFNNLKNNLVTPLSICFIKKLEYIKNMFR